MERVALTPTAEGEIQTMISTVDAKSTDILEKIDKLRARLEAVTGKRAPGEQPAMAQKVPESNLGQRLQKIENRLDEAQIQLRELLEDIKI